LIATMFRHDYPFDPTHGHDLAALLAVTAPEEPADFAPFWRDLHVRSRAVAVAPALRDWRIFLITTFNPDRRPLS
jgi:cephalosporin-C deacetylase